LSISHFSKITANILRLGVGRNAYFKSKKNYIAPYVQAFVVRRILFLALA